MIFQDSDCFFEGGILCIICGYTQASERCRGRAGGVCRAAWARLLAAGAYLQILQLYMLHAVFAQPCVCASAIHAVNGEEYVEDDLFYAGEHGLVCK